MKIWYSPGPEYHKVWEEYVRLARTRTRRRMNTSTPQAQKTNIQKALENIRELGASTEGYIEAQFWQLKPEFCQRTWGSALPPFYVFATPKARVRYRKWRAAVESHETPDRTVRDRTIIRREFDRYRKLSRLGLQVSYESGQISPLLIAALLVTQSPHIEPLSELYDDLKTPRVREMIPQIEGDEGFLEFCMKILHAT